MWPWIINKRLAAMNAPRAPVTPDAIQRATQILFAVFARYGDTFGTQNSGADYDVDDVFQLVAIVDELRAIPARPP